MLTQSLLKELLHYDESTGVFTRKVGHGGKSAGSVAGSVCSDGYIQIKVHGRHFMSHRLAWLYMHGEFPKEQLDHINRNRGDNRIANLRPATQSENQKNRRANANSTSGRKGVVWHKGKGRWRAQARLNGKNHHLGEFHTAEAGSKAYEAFARKHHGEFYYCTSGDKA